MNHEQTRISKQQKAEQAARLCEELRNELRPLLEKVPSRVLNGSYQVVVDYKAAHAGAKKVLAGSRTKPESLQQAISTMRRFFGSSELMVEPKP